MAKLQAGLDKNVARLTGDDAQVGGSLEVGVKTIGKGVGDVTDTESWFKLPVLTSTQRSALTAEAGMQVYDSTLGKEMTYRATGWGSSDGTAASSLDAAYNGGSTVTVDAADVIWDLTDSTNDYKVLIRNSSTGTIATGLLVDTSAASAGCILTDAIKVTTSGAGSTVVDAIDASDAGITNAINVGANVIYGTGGASINFDSFDVDSSGNVTVGGTTEMTGAITATGAIAAASSYTGQGAMIIDVDNAEAFLIRENGDAADVVTVDTTQDAGDTTFKVSSKTTTGIAMHLDTDTTTGQGLLIDADAATTGDALLISVASGTMESSGSAISVIDSSNSDREIFAVRDDGSVLMYGSAEGTDAVTINNGDLTITDGDIVGSGGEISWTDGVTTSGSGISLTSSMTTAGAGAGAAGALTITAASATTGTVLAITADALTSGDMLYLDNGGGTLNGGFYINCNDDNTSDFTVGADGATTITTAVATTAALSVTGVQTSQDMVTFDNTGGVIASDKAVLLLDAGGAVASGGNILRIAPTGTPNAGAIGVEYVGAGKTNQALYIDSDPTGAHVAHIHGGGALTDGKAVLALTNDGNLATGGNLLNVTAGGTPHAAAKAVEIDAQKDMTALYIDSDAATDSAVQITGNGVVGAGKAMLAVTNTAAIADGAFYVDITSGANGAASTDSYLLHVDAAHTNIEAIHVDAGTVKFDESLSVGTTLSVTGAATFTAGQQSAAVARTATDTGATTGTIADGTTYVDVTAGDSANDIIILPSPTTGNVVWLGPAATGYELRSSAPQTVAINGGTATGAESAIATDVLVRCVCTSATTWVCSEFTAAGTESPVQVAAA